MLAGNDAHGLTHAQYLDITASAEGLLEYHDGFVVTMAAPSPEHARIVAQLVRLLQPGTARPCVALPSGLKVRVEATNRTLLPDVTVVCGALERSSADTHAITNPTVVIEVGSPSTGDHDVGSKFHHYRRLPTLREYVAISQHRRFASVSRRAGDLWAFEDVGPSDALRLVSLDLQLPLDALYRDALGDILLG
jgi:Uma2 family endonuclease